MPEPFRMLTDPRMVRGALDREIQRDFEPKPFGHGDEVIEIVERAELRLNRHVTSGGTSNRPRAARTIGCIRLEFACTAISFLPANATRGVSLHLTCGFIEAMFRTIRSSINNDDRANIEQIPRQ